MLRRCVIDEGLEDVLPGLCIDHLLNILLIQWELLRELVRFSEDVHGLLKVLSDQGNTVCTDLVDDASIGQDGLTANQNAINHWH